MKPERNEESALPALHESNVCEATIPNDGLPYEGESVRMRFRMRRVLTNKFSGEHSESAATPC